MVTSHRECKFLVHLLEKVVLMRSFSLKGASMRLFARSASLLRFSDRINTTFSR